MIFSWVSWTAIYFIIWWTTLFAVLPFGVRNQIDEGQVTPGTEPGAVIGPLIDMKAIEKVEEHVSDALAKGARIVLVGEDGTWSEQFVEATDVARAACESAGVQLENEWERELNELMRPSNDLWRSMSRRSLAR